MKNISDRQIEHLAELSALKLSSDEKIKMKNDLGQILGFVDEINKCNTAGVNYDETEITFAELREDKVKPGLKQKEATANAPKAEEGFFVVTKVVD